jgi:hypothetical protein
MKKLKIVLSVFIFLLIFSIGKTTVSADMGPKQASFITIKGIEGNYVACFAAKEAWGPNFDYEYWEEKQDLIDYNPIMEYKDDEGLKWISNYYKCNGKSEIRFTYYCPEKYKIVIYQNDEFLIATEVLEMYAYSTYYEIDFSIPENIKITKTYDYFSEILNLIVRIAITLAIELGLFYAFRLYTERNFKVVFIVNLITQIFLNVVINISLYYSGLLSAIFLLFVLEFIILIIESISYQILLKEKNRLVIIIYTIIANALSFGIGLFIVSFI